MRRWRSKVSCPARSATLPRRCEASFGAAVRCRAEGPSHATLVRPSRFETRVREGDARPCSVIASAAMQSRIFPRRQPGLLRCARNDEVERVRHTLGVIARLDWAIQYSRGGYD